MNFLRVGAMLGVHVNIENFRYCVMRREKSVRLQHPDIAGITRALINDHRGRIVAANRR